MSNYSIYRGYHFYVGGLELPYAPAKLNVTIGSRNETVDLINGNEINILKSPSLTEIEFEIELPRGRQYAFANKLESPIKFTDFFEKLMVNKTPTTLVITRPTPSGAEGNTANGFASNTWNVSLEGYTLKESAENAFDYTVSLKFKEYIKYGTVKKVVDNTGNSTPSKETKVVESPKTHIVKRGDTLWKISHKYYGHGKFWTTIYNANLELIEYTAKRFGHESSSKGHWIFPGTHLTIPVRK